ncbi:LysM peptidoglycan-binding domain-containing protein [Tunturibacter psychrotolerans]|uniref:LysM peptidoglycan-binding domain-containing protein n=1 Tax=Tunturiibacter psychrotolerans TaxID=3069686 RepID=A0AAU7ZRR1_9BACT
MPLEKLTILPENSGPIQALFNPEHYTVSKSLQLAEVVIPGLDAPVVQYVRGQNEKVTMELFFDTTDFGMVDPVVDVRSLTGQIYQLLKIDGNLHAPPRVQLAWGTGGKLTSYGASISPWLLLESISEEFSLFSPQGVPLRAKLNVSFREAWTIAQQLQVTPRHSSDRTTLHQVVRGETLAQISYQQYKDPTQWRLIADANSLANPRLLTPGQTLTIPPYPSSTTTTGGQ